MTPPLIADTATARHFRVANENWLLHSCHWDAPIVANVDGKITLVAETNKRYAAAFCEAANSYASLKARVAELEANERAYEAALGQRTYNEVALHIKELTEALQEIGQYAKKLRKSSDLVGPAEYANDPRALKVWQRALYHEGKTIGGMVKAALHGSEIFEPEKAATARALTNGDAS